MALLTGVWTHRAAPLSCALFHPHPCCVLSPWCPCSDLFSNKGFFIYLPTENNPNDHTVPVHGLLTMLKLSASAVFATRGAGKPVGAGTAAAGAANLPQPWF